jgi:primase-polymerase (primpol)-like protein
MNISTDPKTYKQWLPFIYKPRDNGKLGKAPISAQTNRLVNQHDPAHWLTFEAARDYAKCGLADGYGFVLTETGDPFCVPDIDSATDHPVITKLNSYTEYSVSGNGLHIWIALTDKRKLPVHPTGCTNLELFTAGFITVTGRRYPGAPCAIRALSVADLAADLGIGLEQPGPTADPPPPTYFSTSSQTGHRTYKTPVQAMTDSELWQYIFRNDPTGNLQTLALNDLSSAGGATMRGSRERVSQAHYRAVSTLACSLARWTGNDSARIKRMLSGTSLAHDDEAKAWDRPWRTRGEETFIDHMIANAIRHIGGHL